MTGNHHQAPGIRRPHHVDRDWSFNWRRRNHLLPIAWCAFHHLYMHFFFCLWLCIIHIFICVIYASNRNFLFFPHFTFDPRWLVFIIYRAVRHENHQVFPVGIKGLTRYPNLELNQLVPVRNLFLVLVKSVIDFRVDWMCSEFTNLLKKTFCWFVGKRIRPTC